MSIHRFFKKQSFLAKRARGFAFLLVIVLISGCGEEAVDNNPLVGTVEEGAHDEVAPLSTIYYPMTLGSRWTYRNPDGSEWTREVTETKKFGDNLYHYFSSDPPRQDTQIESLRSPVYAAFLDRLVRRTNLKDTNAAIWEIIVESGGESQNWSLGMSCNKQGGRKAVCVSKKDKSTPGILTYLYHSEISVVRHGKLALFRLPLVPGETYKALDLRLRGRDDGPFYIHDFEAEVVILGKISADRELAEVSAGAFEDCLKIQYEAKLASYRTLEFRDVGGFPMLGQDAYLKAVESGIREELTDLLTSLTPKLGLQTVWLAPGVGPVKIETPNGIAELIDYEIKPVAADLYRIR